MDEIYVGSAYFNALIYPLLSLYPLSTHYYRSILYLSIIIALFIHYYRSIYPLLSLYLSIIIALSVHYYRSIYPLLSLYLSKPADLCRFRHPCLFTPALAPHAPTASRCQSPSSSNPRLVDCRLMYVGSSTEIATIKWYALFSSTE